MTFSHNLDDFKFDRRSLSIPRKPGISAYMRIKDEEEFVDLAIRSHLEFYDEIIAVYNGCTDNTEKVLLELREQYPEKIKVYHYLPEVHPLDSEAHRRTPTDSVHSMANYSNYALSKTTFSVAVKLDGDHLAIAQNLAPLVETIRRDIYAGKQKIYTFSGVNLIRKSGAVMVGGWERCPFSGQGEIMYHPVGEDIAFHQNEFFEGMKRPASRQMEREYQGIMYFHLKHLKKDFGYANLSEDMKEFYVREMISSDYAIPFSEFYSSRNIRKMASQFSLRNRLRYSLYKNSTIRKLKYKLCGKHPNLKTMRLIRLTEDLKGIDFKHDVLDKLS